MAGLNRRGSNWREQTAYQNFMARVQNFENCDGVTVEYIQCKKIVSRLIPLAVCIKGLQYFEARNRHCRACWGLAPKTPYPEEFNGPKETRIPEMQAIINPAPTLTKNHTATKTLKLNRRPLPEIYQDKAVLALQAQGFTPITGRRLNRRPL